MLRNFARGVMVVALIICARAAWSAGTADDDIPGQVRAAIKQLDGSTDRTAASRLVLAKVAANTATAKAAKDPAGAVDAWKAAQEALADALRLEPTNKEAADMMAMVVKHIPAPATAPATQAAAPATKPGPDTKPAAPPAFAVKREVTPAEINRIRQIEWKPDENPKPSLRVEPETRKKFLQASPDIMPGEFNKLTPDAQAAQILASGKEEFYPGVHINTDPASMREFKTAVNQRIVTSCATANCHGGAKPGAFVLFPEKNDAAVYTNFIALQNYGTTVNGAQRLMIDRTTPESSLLLEFMLPSDQTNAPHPTATGFKPPAKVKTAANYEALLKWLKSLDPLAPTYGVDLTTPPAAPVVAPK